MNDWVKVDDCPEPIVGLEWEEMFSYRGRVIEKVQTENMPFPYFVCEDSVSEYPYLLNAREFKKKFSYETTPGCWVRFRFPESNEQI